MTSEIEQLLSAKEVLVACGPGGVGKTTTSAAVAAMAASRLGGKVLVLTVDPARRLADALGVSGLGNEAVRIPDAAFEAAGVKPKGQLFAAMLDMSESWDALVRRHAPDAATAAQILANPLYQNITRRFAQGHDYIAMERLYELHEPGDYDLLVVDTPPSSHAIDLLDAPARMQEFFSSRLLRWLTVPYRSRLVNAASRPFYHVADRVLGSQLLQDLADFFILFQTMRDGFVARADAVDQLLRDVRTSFLVVTTLEAVPSRDAAEMMEALSQRKLHLGVLVCNKVLPGSLTDSAAASVADRMSAESETLAAAVLDTIARRGETVDAAVVQRVFQEVGESFSNLRLVATRESELLRELSAAHEVTVTVPYQAGHVTDLAGLLQMGARIWGDTTDDKPQRTRAVIDYHVHLWPHSEVADEGELALDRIAAYTEQAAREGVAEIALTEHFFRFVQGRSVVEGWWRDFPEPAGRPIYRSVEEYFDHHATADLDRYVETALAAKAAGLPVVLGLEVDYYAGRMDDVAALLAGYPFDVLLGSVHWIENWMFDDLSDAVQMGEWDRRPVADAWRAYADALDELAGTGACDVLAHPDLIKVAGRLPDRGVVDECEARIAEAAQRSGMAAEISSAGALKPCREDYPSPSLLDRFSALAVPITFASDSHGSARVGERNAELSAAAASAGYDSVRRFRARVADDVSLA